MMIDSSFFCESSDVYIEHHLSRQKSYHLNHGRIRSRTVNRSASRETVSLGYLVNGTFRSWACPTLVGRRILMLSRFRLPFNMIKNGERS